MLTTTNNPIDRPIKFSGHPNLERTMQAKKHQGGIKTILNPHLGYECSKGCFSTPLEYYEHHDCLEPYHLEAVEKFEHDYLADLTYLKPISPFPRVRSCLNTERGRSLDDDEDEQLKEAACRYNDLIGKFTKRQRVFLLRVIGHDPKNEIERSIEQKGMCLPPVIDAVRRLLDRVAWFYGIRELRS